MECCLWWCCRISSVVVARAKHIRGVVVRICRTVEAIVVVVVVAAVLVVVMMLNVVAVHCSSHHTHVHGGRVVDRSLLLLGVNLVLCLLLLLLLLQWDL